MIVGDSYFGNIELVEELKRQGRKSIFTANHPKWLFQDGLHKTWSKKGYQVGECHWIRREDGIFALSWMDCSLVNFVGYGFEPSVEIEFKKKKRGEKNGALSTMPLIAKIYRTYYHGLGISDFIFNNINDFVFKDQFDKAVCTWRIQNRAPKWTITVFWSLLKFGIVNAWQLYKQSQKKQITQVNFIRSVYLGLVGKNMKKN